MRLNSGRRFNSRIIIQSATETKNALHEIEKNWSTVATIWANVEPMKTDEAFDADKVNARTVINVMTRARNDLTTSMRLVYAGANYEITGVSPYDARRATELTAVSIV